LNETEVLRQVVVFKRVQKLLPTVQIITESLYRTIQHIYANLLHFM